MKTLTFLVTIEGLPDHANDYRVQGDVCAGAMALLRKGYSDGQVNVIVTTNKELPYQTFHLCFDGETKRYERAGYGLHCGDGLTALIDGGWVETRIEHSGSSTHSRGWYLVTHPNTPLEGLLVRKDAA